MGDVGGGAEGGAVVRVAARRRQGTGVLGERIIVIHASGHRPVGMNPDVEVALLSRPAVGSDEMFGDGVHDAAGRIDVVGRVHLDDAARGVRVDRGRRGDGRCSITKIVGGTDRRRCEKNPDHQDCHQSNEASHGRTSSVKDRLQKPTYTGIASRAG